MGFVIHMEIYNKLFFAPVLILIFYYFSHYQEYYSLGQQIIIQVKNSIKTHHF